MKIFNKKAIAGFELSILIIASFAFSFIIYSSTLPVVSAVSTSSSSTLSSPSVCCEKIKKGAFCINTDEANCDANFKKSPTSCDSTSYCKQGTCYDSSEGICMENTPQRVCSESKGAWDVRGVDELPQCQLGCCIIVDQAAFVPLVRCKRLSSLFGVENNYRTDITSEVDCIATAQSQDMGACVFEKDFERICKFTTRNDCNAPEEVLTSGKNASILGGEKKFYKDYLCSAEELGTSCARQASTNCYQQKVYWFDSCGNRENIYSGGDKKEKDNSWNSGKVLDADSICDANDGGDKECGNCDYLLGTRCSKWESFLGIGKPKDSDYFCKKTVCVDRNGEEKKNGENWCVYDSSIGNGTDPVGSRYYREVCVDGEVKIEACGDYRNQICLQNSMETEEGDFGVSGCRVNRWQDCVLQTDKKDCENIDRRDCIWTAPVTGMMLGGGKDGQAQGQETQQFSNPTQASASTGQEFTNPTSPATGNVIAPITGNALFGGDDSEEKEEPETTTNRPGGICVPNYPPGLKFWEEGDAIGICGQASAQCVVTYEKKIIGGKKCVDNCECLEEEWAQQANKVCTALGDCGGYINYQGKYTDDGYEWKVDNKEKKFAPNTVNQIKSSFTARVISAAITGNFLAPLTGFATEGVPTEILRDKTGSLYKVSEGEIYFMKSGSAGWVDISSYTPENWKILTADATPVNGINTGGSASGLQTATGKQIGTLTSIKSTASGISQALSAKIPDGAKIFGGEVGGKAIKITTETVFQQPDGKYFITDGTNSIIATKAQLIEQGIPIDKMDFKGPTSQNMFSNFLGLQAGTGWDALLSGVQWAAIAYGLGYLVGGMIGLNKDNQQALATAMAAGAFAYKYLATLKTGTMHSVISGLPGGSWMLAHPAVMGIGVAVVVFLLMYKKESIEVVTFTCHPWQAPVGGNECEKCNPDNNEGLPCSEYRCRSLGQNCELVNPGTEEEKCVNVNPGDVEPPIITPDVQVLTQEYKYDNTNPSPPSSGVKILRKEGLNKCIEAFTPLKFGINTNEPAQCKIDINHTNSFDEMANWFGGTNLFLYNHSETLSLPGPSNLEGENLTMPNDGKWTFFVRCRDRGSDKNKANENEAEYAINFCVDESPDSTAPQIKATSIENGNCIAADTGNALTEFYVNEPADCRWSKEDQSYDVMQNTMICSNQIYQMNALQLYTCAANLTGIGRDETTFYVRCKDQPNKQDNDRNVNRQSYVFRLRGSSPLKIKYLQPNGTVYGAVNPSPVTLSVKTLFGCEDGKAICYYSTTDNDADYIRFFDTDNEDGIHTQRQDLTAGIKTYYYKCVDSGGNVAVNSTTFTLDIDANAPVIARVYEEDELLKIVTVRNSECSYTYDNCDFLFQEGINMPYANTTSHVAEWKEDKTYYIKCRDEFRNEEADCSLIVRPTTNFL